MGKSIFTKKTWGETFTGLMECMNDTVMTVKVEDVGCDYRFVGDRARTTINLDGGDKAISENYMYKMYRCEHTPIRCRKFLVSFINIPYSLAMHFVRHNQGVIPFVSTGRDDRVEVNADTIRDRDNIPVRLDLECNAQALINISRKRLCKQAHRNTIKAWKIVKELMREIDLPLYANMVADCVYRGGCFEYKPCGYADSNDFAKEFAKHCYSEFDDWKNVDETAFPNYYDGDMNTSN